MRKFIKDSINRIPFIQKLNERVRVQSEQIRKQGAYPAGHYYSPIPAEEDLIKYLESRKLPDSKVVGIDLNEEEQKNLLDSYIEFYKDIPFHEQPTDGIRYWYNNTWFGRDDAIFLHCFLRKHEPKRIIEVGSGFSSAVMLDTADTALSQQPQLTFIEPDPSRLLGLLKDSDKERVTIIDRKIQEVPPEVLLALDSGDLLFIDSSHVVKCDSDLHYLMFEVLPRLKPGVFVHFHDVFYPFEYPSEWLMEGRYWNENYFLRAFLLHNTEWKITFFTTYIQHIFGDLLQAKMPFCSRNTAGGLCIGGSLYIQRR
jgi:predicted O-methyltransferase YrrM